MRRSLPHGESPACSLLAFPSVTWRFRFSLSVLLAAFLLGGCDATTVLPFAPHENYFTVFGYLDASADSQFVRVIPIRLKLGRPDASDEIDAEVYLHAFDLNVTLPFPRYQETYTDGSEGLRFADGSFGFVYLGQFTPDAGDSYELEVRRRDGKTTRARTVVPTVAAPVLYGARVARDSIYQTIVMPGLTRPPHQIRIEYRLTSSLFNRHPGKLVTVNLFHPGAGKATEEGWQYDLNLTREALDIRAFVAANLSQFSTLNSVGNPATFPLYLHEYRVSVGVLDAAWDFVGPDPDLAQLAQPGAASNVENGFGFFGAVGWGAANSALDRATLAAIGLAATPPE